MLTAIAVPEVQHTDRLEPLLTLEESAGILKRSHWTLRKDIAAGRVRCVRMGRRILLEAAEVRRLIEQARQ